MEKKWKLTLKSKNFTLTEHVAYQWKIEEESQGIRDKTPRIPKTPEEVDPTGTTSGTTPTKEEGEVCHGRLLEESTPEDPESLGTPLPDTTPTQEPIPIPTTNLSLMMMFSRSLFPPLDHKWNKLKQGGNHKTSLQHEFNKVLQRLTQSGLLARAIKRQSGVVDLVQVFEIQEL